VLRDQYHDERRRIWRQELAAKAEGIAQEIERLARRAVAADLPVTAYILELAVEEARKERAAKHTPSICRIAIAGESGAQ
jgi:hypothetical protein